MCRAEIATVGMFVALVCGWTHPSKAQNAGTALTPVPIQDRAVLLTPSNTMIQFIGAHAGSDPNPRVGYFRDFAGQARLDAAGSAVESITVEIQTESLSTPMGNLTNHLKSPDFLDVREHPSAKFQTTQIAPLSEAGTFQVTGELTLHGTTSTLTFPATISIAGSGVTLAADLTIDRTDFGMDQLTERVVKEVELHVAIGKAAPAEGEAGEAQVRRFDPREFFNQRDANDDGILSGDELTQRMRDSLADFDTDNDGAVSSAEFEVRLQALGAGPRGDEARQRGNR